MRPSGGALFRLMLADVLESVSAAAGLAGVAVVSRDPEAAAIARRHGSHGAMAAGSCRKRQTGAKARPSQPARRPLARRASLPFRATCRWSSRARSRPCWQRTGRRRPSPSSRPGTAAARTASPARPPMPSPSTSATTASAATWPRPGIGASSRGCCACPASRSISIRRRMCARSWTGRRTRGPSASSTTGAWRTPALGAGVESRPDREAEPLVTGEVA